MPQFPRNLFEFGQMFSTEDACVQYLIETRWPEGFQCPGCPSSKFHWYPDRNAFKCYECNEWIYLTQGTVMEKSRTPICKWFLGAYLMTTLTPGISAVQFQRQAGLTRYETAFQMLHKLRSAMVRPERGQLTGHVEVDESFVGGAREGTRGRGAAGKAIVVGAVEVIRIPRGYKAGRVRLQEIQDASQESLLPFIMDYVEPGSTVVTDGWLAYQNLASLGYRHEVVEGEDSTEVAEQLVHIHRVFSNLKSWLIGTHHGVSEKHLQAYLNEFTFRFNRRSKPFETFNAILGLASNFEAPTYEELYATGEEDGWVHPNPEGYEDEN